MKANFIMRYAPVFLAAVIGLNAWQRCAEVSFAAPVKPSPTPKAEKPAEASPAPKLPVKTNWGSIKQDGLKFVIEGNPAWWGEGEIRPDGKSVVIYWINTSSEEARPAFGSYLLIDGKMEGRWGWSGDVSETLPGTLDGGNAEVIQAPAEEKEEG